MTPYDLSYNKNHNLIYVAVGNGIIIIDLKDLSQTNVFVPSSDSNIKSLAVDDVNKLLYYSCKSFDSNGLPAYAIKYLNLTDSGKTTGEVSYKLFVKYDYNYMIFKNDSLYLTSSTRGINEAPSNIFVLHLLDYSTSLLYVGNHINHGLEIDSNGNLYVNYFISGDQYQNGVDKIDVNKNVTNVVRFSGTVNPTGLTFANNKMYVGLAPNGNANVNLIVEVPFATDIMTLSAQTATLTREVSKLGNSISKFLAPRTSTQLLNTLLDLSLAYLNTKPTLPAPGAVCSSVQPGSDPDCVITK